MISTIASLRYHAICLFLVSFQALLAAGDDFPQPYDTEKELRAGPLAPDEAARRFAVPDGFHVGVFDAEPNIRNPIAQTWDTRGRLWVAENFTYSEAARKYDQGLRDRLLILKDADGDGRADQRHVFSDSLQRLISVAVGLDGVWVMCPPQLLFIPDRDGDDLRRFDRRADAWNK